MKQRNPRKEKKSRKKIEQEIQTLLEKILNPYDIRIKGNDYHVVPAFIQDSAGDGLQLIWLSSLDTRPQFYILRIDSHWDIDSDNFDYEYMLTLISERYGDADNYVCIDYDNDIYVMDWEVEAPNANKYTWDDLSFPMLKWGDGGWGLIKNFRTGKVERNYLRNIHK